MFSDIVFLKNINKKKEKKQNKKILKNYILLYLVAFIKCQ